MVLFIIFLTYYLQCNRFSHQVILCSTWNTGISNAKRLIFMELGTNKGREVCLECDQVTCICPEPDGPEPEVAEIEQRYLTPAQASRYTGIPSNTLNAWRYEGKGPNFYKPRGRVLYDKRELDQFIRSGIRKSSTVRAKPERIA